MRDRVETSVVSRESRENTISKELLRDRVAFIAVLLLIVSMMAGLKGKSNILTKIAVPMNVSYNSDVEYTSVGNDNTIDGKWVSVDGKSLLDIETNRSLDEVRIVIRDKYNVFNTIGKYSSDGNMIECDNGMTVNISSDKATVEIDTANKDSISFNRFI